MDKWGVFLSGCLTNCKGVNRTIFIQLNMRLYCSCILTLVLLCFFLLPPPPSGHLASLTLALAWPTFLGFIHQEKKQDSHWHTLKSTQVTKTLRPAVYSPNKHKCGIFSDYSQLCNYVNCRYSTVGKHQLSHYNCKSVY